MNRLRHWARVVTCVLLVGLLGGCSGYTYTDPTPLPGPTLEEFTRATQPLLIELIARLEAETGVEFAVKPTSVTHVDHCPNDTYSTWRRVSDIYSSVAIPVDMARRVGDEVLGKAFPRFSTHTVFSTASGETPHRILSWYNPDTGGGFTVSIDPRTDYNFTAVSWESGCRSSPKYDENPRDGWMPEGPPDPSRKYTVESFVEFMHPLLGELLAELGEATGEYYELPPPLEKGRNCTRGGTSIGSVVYGRFINPDVLFQMGNQVLSDAFPIYEDRSSSVWVTHVWTNEAEDGWFMLASFSEEETFVLYRSNCLATDKQKADWPSYWPTPTPTR